MKITTNHVWREFKCRHEVPKKILDTQFDWTKEDEDVDGFFHYKGTWYHLSLFMRHAPEGWDGIHHDSFFSGVLIKLSADGERFKVATYFA